MCTQVKICAVLEMQNEYNTTFRCFFSNWCVLQFPFRAQSYLVDAWSLWGVRAERELFAVHKNQQHQSAKPINFNIFSNYFAPLCSTKLMCIPACANKILNYGQNSAVAHLYRALIYLHALLVFHIYISHVLKNALGEKETHWKSLKALL